MMVVVVVVVVVVSNQGKSARVAFSETIAAVVARLLRWLGSLSGDGSS